ncbi:hypothetical protein SPHINGOR109_50144 [Sphingorhabdus sp. 109]|nr:hypothetical protein SPHINGOR109_50144 [Sphingorhabdus sp. 109]
MRFMISSASSGLAGSSVRAPAGAAKVVAAPIASVIASLKFAFMDCSPEVNWVI